MYNIKLINMPFAAEHLPSLALTQLRSVLHSALSGRVQVEICYLNLDIAERIGPLYHEIEDSMEHLHTGLGEWLFRHSAFPDAPDNTQEYFRRCYPRQSVQVQALAARVGPLRAQLDAMLDELIDDYRLDAADLVGFTSIFAQNLASLAMARKIKARAPHIVTVIGGPNCEYPMGAVLVQEAPQIDFAFSGPALKSFVQFVRYILGGEPQRCQRIHGVVSRDNLDAFVAQEDKLILAPDLIGAGAYFPSNQVQLRDPARPLPGGETQDRLQQVGEELPIGTALALDYDDYLDAFERKPPPHADKPTLLVETSRGCWWGEHSHCTFCGLNDLTLGYRAMGVEQATAQVQSLFRYVGRVERIMAVDVIIPKELLSEMLPRLATPPTMELFYEAKSNLTEEQVRNLARARVKTIQPGIEALSTSVLKLLKKGSTVFQNIALLKRCVMYDVMPSWNLLLGIPRAGEEMYRTYADLIPLLTHLPPPSDVLQVRFDRFSPYFTHAAEFGLKLAPMEHYGLIYPVAQAKLEDLAYFFRDTNYDADYFVHLANWFTTLKELVALWRRRWPERDPEARAQLFVMRRGDELAIHDSRSGRTLEYPIAPATWSVLTAFEERTTPDLVQARLPGFDLDRELDFLTSKGLLLHERGRYMSLVLPGRAPLQEDEDLRGWEIPAGQAELRTVISL
jgi:radical SAM superfamily enzyme YgiQ (UPF0313 family)